MKETRAEKAQRLVDEGRVGSIDTYQGYTLTCVQGDHETYAVSLCPSGRYYCLCKWGRIHWNSRDLCAHALAVKLAAERKD